MNEVFLIGKVISSVEFEFMINSKHISFVNFKIETLDGQVINIIAYDRLADFVYGNLKIGDMAFIYGRLKFNYVQVEVIAPFYKN